MKRDWDLLRKQLTDIEEGCDVLADIPDTPKWTNDLVWEDYDRMAKVQRTIEERIAGHLELLINNRDQSSPRRGQSLFVRRLCAASYDGWPRFARHDAIRDYLGVHQINRAKKSIELTFDAIKALAGFALKQALGG